eukprot:gene25246-6403_t
MLRLILSPAKTMNFELPAVQLATQGDYQTSVHAVFSSLASKSKAELKKLLAVSDQLAQLNFDRMKAFVGNPAAVTEPILGSFKQASLAYDGPAFKGLDAASLSPE